MTINGKCIKRSPSKLILDSTMSMVDYQRVPNAVEVAAEVAAASGCG